MNTLDATFKNENKKLHNFHKVGNIFVSTSFKKMLKRIIPDNNFSATEGKRIAIEELLIQNKSSNIMKGYKNITWVIFVMYLAILFFTIINENPYQNIVIIVLGGLVSLLSVTYVEEHDLPITNKILDWLSRRDF